MEDDNNVEQGQSPSARAAHYRGQNAAVAPEKPAASTLSAGASLANTLNREARLRHIQALQAHAYRHAYLILFRLRHAYLHACLKAPAACLQGYGLFPSASISYNRDVEKVAKMNFDACNPEENRLQ